MLKNRQTQEKMLMFQELMSGMDENDTMKQYLAQQQSRASKELEQYKKKTDKDKQKRIQDMEEERERKMQELAERQSRMFNWEDKVRREEA